MSLRCGHMVVSLSFIPRRGVGVSEFQSDLSHQPLFHLLLLCCPSDPPPDLLVVGWDRVFPFLIEDSRFLVPFLASKINIWGDRIAHQNATIKVEPKSGLTRLFLYISWSALCMQEEEEGACSCSTSGSTTSVFRDSFYSTQSCDRNRCSSPGFSIWVSAHGVCLYETRHTLNDSFQGMSNCCT